MIERGDWQVSDIARNSFDLEGKVVGTIGAGRIGYRVLQRLVPFDCKEFLYYDYAALPEGELADFTPRSLSSVFHHASWRKGPQCSPRRGPQGIRLSMRRRHH